MNFNELRELDQNYIANTYARMPVHIQAGSGVDCHGLDDKEYIDFSSGIGVNSLGFANSRWVKAVTEQAEKLAHMSNIYYTTPQVELAKALCERTGMKRVFFANSGAEANEGAIKTARKYGGDKYGPHRKEIITLLGSFHGRTITTLAATGQDVFHKHFGPFTPGFSYARPNDVEDLTAKISSNTCAILLELIQGEGGVMPLDDSYVQHIQRICKDRDILMIVDEVQTGVGRTGRFLCSEYFGIQPDIITLAKGLGGGLPIGAVLFGEKVKDTLGFGDHGTTYGGNPITTAGALAVLESVDGDFLDTVAANGEFLAHKLRNLPEVVSVSGRGLMLGAELLAGMDSREVAMACAANGLVVLTAKHKLRFLPPLNITREQIDKGIAILAKTLKEIKESTAK